MIGMQITLDKADMAKIDYILKNMDKKLGKKTVMKALRDGAKPLITMAKSKAPVSGKKTFLTAHRHISKGIQSTKLRRHRAGELKRSIGAVVGRGGWSLYIGPRYGSNRVNDAWYAHFVEFGTVRRVVRKKRFIPVLGITLEKGDTIKGIEGVGYMRKSWDNTYNKSLQRISENLSKITQQFLQKNKP